MAETQRELRNGQVWRQLGFPCFEIVVLMLGSGDKTGELLWCKAGTGGVRHPPLVMTDHQGKWAYTESELLATLLRFRYTLVGEARVVAVEATEA